MGAKIVIRVRPDDRVEVRVEGLEEPRRDTPPGEKICEKITRRIERDLGAVVERTYDDEGVQDVAIETDERLPDENLHG